MAPQSKLKINVYAMKHLDHQVERAKLFIDGLTKHGVQATLYSHTAAVACDLAVFWGMHYSSAIRAAQQTAKQPWLIMERGYVGDRFKWTSLGYNGLNGHANFLNNNSPSDRWDKYFGDSMLLPWHSGNYVLVTGQVMQDASIKHLKVNYQTIVDDIKKHTDLPVFFRKHPHKLAINTPTPSGSATSQHTTLESALSGARVCVTVNSNSAVDAILAGTPVINLDKGSMAWDIAESDYNSINSPPFPDRRQWAHNIAYAQWLNEEIQNGDAWEHLKSFFV